MSELYKLENVVKTYKKRNETVQALNNLNLTVQKGDFLTIQGSTGGGKSTLLQMLGGLDIPSKGDITFEDKKLSKASSGKLTKLRAEQIGFIFQSFNLIPTLTARENVEMGLVPLKLSKVERRKRAEETLKSVELGDRMDHYPSELSGGQQQRVAIARALAKKPEVLLSDEPTGSLDESTRDEIFNLLENLWRQEGITLIVVTHDSYIAKKGSRRISLKAGKIVKDSLNN